MAPRPGFIHATAVIGDPPEHRDWTPDHGDHGVEIDATAQINSFVTVDAGYDEPTRVGARTFLMTKTHIGHCAQVGADCELAPGTVIGGHAILEDGVRCGIGVLVRPRVRVGAHARLGAGAVVVKDVPAGATFVGNPAAPIHSGQSIDRLRDLAWAAGLFEGEGFFTSSRSVTDGRTYRRLRAGLETSDRDVLERFREIVGCGRIYERGPRSNPLVTGAKPMFCWSLNGSANFLGFYEMLGEWLGVRRRATAEQLLDDLKPGWREQGRLFEARGEFLTPLEVEGWEAVATHECDPDFVTWMGWYDSWHREAAQ